MSGLMPNGNGLPAQGETDLGQELLSKSLDTALVLVAKAGGTQSAAEAKDFAAGVLALSQVIALLDPSRDTQGIPLGHHVAMTKLKGEQELQRVKEQAKAQAQQPKKTVTAQRGPNGSRTYQVNG